MPLERHPYSTASCTSAAETGDKPEVSFGRVALPEGKLALPDEVVDWGHPAPEPRAVASAHTTPPKYTVSTSATYGKKVCCTQSQVLHWTLLEPQKMDTLVPI